MYIMCLDLEGILVPEIWINVAEKTGIEELRLTTRDIPDYDQLMKGRLDILKREGLTISDIREVIQLIEPLAGAKEFLEWAREKFQVIILSDTFVQFADPLLKKLHRPTLLCNTLVISPEGVIENYRLRQNDGKKHAVEALKSLNFQVIAVGDSYNDTTMLNEADQGILFRPPENVKREFPQYPVIETYEDLKSEVAGYADR
jgi:phosphoserine / homoserine phosphotransferase